MTLEEELIAASEAAVSEPEKGINLKERLRYHCLKRGYNGVLALGRFLRLREEKESKKLKLDDLTEALQEAGIDVAEDEAQDLFKELDIQEEGVVNSEDILNVIRPEMNEERMALVEKAFEKLDESGDGMITVDDIKEKYSAANHPKVIEGVDTEEQVLERFLNRFEGHTENDGKVTKAEFVDYYSAISKAIDSDDYFIEMMTNCWKIE